MAAQLTFTSGLSRRRLRARGCARANSSLPVPVSPEEEDRRVRGRDLAHLGEDVKERCAASEDLPRPLELAQLGAQILRLAGQGGDAPLRLEALVDVPQDQREVAATVELEERQRPLGQERASSAASAR